MDSAPIEGGKINLLIKEIETLIFERELHL